MNKYLEGSIYQNNYAEGIAGITAIGIGATLYSQLGKKYTFILSYFLTLTGGTMILLLETDQFVLPTHLLAALGGIEGEDPAESTANLLVPKVTFVAKFGIALAYLSTYQASFSDEEMFPIEKRSTAIGTCQLLARALTIFAPLITELPQPQPILCFISLAAFSFAVSFTFRSEPAATANKMEKEVEINHLEDRSKNI